MNKQYTPGYEPCVFLTCEERQYTRNVPCDIRLDVRLQRRTKNADICLTLPKEVSFAEENVYVNVIGRGETQLIALAEQYPGRCGIGYERAVGCGSVARLADGRSELHICGVDLRPDNGVDVALRISGACVTELGCFRVEVSATAEVKGEAVTMHSSGEISCVARVTGFRREHGITRVSDGTPDKTMRFVWPEIADAEQVAFQCSEDQGETWQTLTQVSGSSHTVGMEALKPCKEYWFRLNVAGGAQAGASNIAKAYTGLYNVREQEHVVVDGVTDAAPAINRAIEYLHGLGGGALLLEGGMFGCTTIELKSNVHIYIADGVEIHAVPGCWDPELNWFTDPEYRSEVGGEDADVRNLPENWVTKQDEGHSFFRNALFYGQRVDNVKIVGGCVIRGMGVIYRENEFNKRPSGMRADKIFSLKLCTNIELGGRSVGKDLWYEETCDTGDDEPFYLEADGSGISRDISNMMVVEEGGHFVLLATGTDGLSVHDLYTTDGVQIRDILDLMGCSDVQVCNIYSNTTHDDIVKLGSDCSLGFTRKARNYIVRNVVADTGCNVFQIGSETADDLADVCVDNMYVMAAGKAGFSATVNDGAHMNHVHLNCGGTLGQCLCGVKHPGLDIGYRPSAVHPRRTVMRRVRVPYFVTISHRSRVIGAKRQDGFVPNVMPGRIGNIYLGHMTVSEAYGGSRATNLTDNRWPAYDDQPRTTSMVIGLELPETVAHSFADGTRISCVKGVTIEDIDMTVKGGNPPEDTLSVPPEQYGETNGQRYLSRDNRGSAIPAYGGYIRHAENVTVRDYRVRTEAPDGRYALVMDDVKEVFLEDTPECVFRFVPEEA